VKILITGVSGFLGGELAVFFSRKKVKTIGLYNSSKPRLKKNNYLKLIKSDLTKKSPSINADVIIHCASLTPVNTKDNFKLYKKNIKMMKNIISNKIHPKYFFLMSTMSVYGVIKSNKVKINTKKINPNYYGKSKIECEKILKKYQQKNKVNCFVFRLPGVVGKYSHSNFITNLVENFLKNRKFVISNIESNFNNIVHVQDIFD